MKTWCFGLLVAALVSMTSAWATDVEFFEDDGLRGDRNGRLTCEYKETGWEEHWGGHSSCDACLAKHGECEAKCYDTSHRCDAMGTDGSGRRFTTTAYSRRSEWEARDKALDRCYREGGRDCRIERCGEERELVERYLCRRR